MPTNLDAHFLSRFRCPTCERIHYLFTNKCGPEHQSKRHSWTEGFLERVDSFIDCSCRSSTGGREREQDNDSIQNILGTGMMACKSSVNLDCRKSRTFTLTRDNPTLKQWDNLKETCPRQIEKAKQGPCRYCTYLNFVDLKNGVTNAHKIGRTYWMCPHCQVPLCKGRCFDSFHNW